MEQNQMLEGQMRTGVTFRKQALLFYESETFCVVLMIISLTCLPIVGTVMSIVFGMLFLVLALASPRLYNEYISIDEYGIACHKAGKLLWAYEWSSVADLRRSSRYRLPSVEVITYCHRGEPEQYALPNHYFQLGSAARKAIKRYYKSADNI